MASEGDILSEAHDALTAQGLDPERVAIALAAIRRRWGGSECYILSIDRASRDAEIQWALDAGASVEEAAKRVGCSVSTVRRRRSSWL